MCTGCKPGYSLSKGDCDPTPEGCPANCDLCIAKAKANGEGLCLYCNIGFKWVTDRCQAETLCDENCKTCSDNTTKTRDIFG